MQQQNKESQEQLVSQLLRDNSCQDLYACLRADVWPAICTTLDNSAPEDKAKAIILLDKILTRLMVDLQPGETALNHFEVAFAEEILLKVLAKVQDMYCCTGCCEILQKCFVTGSPESQSLKQAIFSKAALVDTLLKGVSDPALHLPSFNFRTRAAVLKIYQQFTLQKSLFLERVAHPITFIQSVLAAIEAEKDPRNLVLCFDLTHFMLVYYMSPHTSAFYRDTAKEVREQLEESFFDEIACYFPINFTPPKNDTRKITPEQLQQMLAKCMLATPALVQHIVPYLLEKLSAKQMNTKNESLRLLGQMTQTFSVNEFIDPSS